MTLLLAALAVLLAGAVLSLHSSRLGSGAAILASLLALAGAFGGSQAFHADWSVPMGSLDLRLDPLSAWFLAPTALLIGLGAWYGREYGHGSWFFYNLLGASMIAVLLAADGVLFLVAWECMGLASWFLVTSDDEREEVRRAGWIYLVATHLGTAFLLAYFMLAGQPGVDPTVLFLLALVGFGTKAGLAPMHLWLPEAHPVAPAHVSALMSGAMIKAGIYGILRAVQAVGPPEPSWGLVVLILGAATALFGVAMALAQTDLKRLLAWSSVENVGLIALGLGLALRGMALGSPEVAALALAGALVHVWTHSAFKSLLFFAAGAVLQRAGTGNLERLGGLARRMPRTTLAFGIGAAGLAGVPPLGGFVGEFLIGLAAFAALADGLPVGGVITVLTVALVSGLAVACFTRAFGTGFLGVSRTRLTADDPGPAMGLPMAAQAGLGFLFGLAAPAVLALAPVPEVLGEAAGPVLEAASSAVARVSLVGLGVVLGVAALAGLRQRLGRPARQSPTWGCGYPAPTPRMQYTATSYAAPLTDLLLRPRVEAQPVEGLFPGPTRVDVESSDPVQVRVWQPLFAGVARLAERLRWLQHGRLQFYVLYLLLTLVVLVLWGIA